MFIEDFFSKLFFANSLFKNKSSMAPTRSPTPVTARQAKTRISKSTRMALEDEVSELSIITCSTVRKTNPKTNQMNAQGLMHAIFLPVLGENTFFIRII